jgi:glycosyltransferase involved in cell wall biosynthesis
LPYNKNIFVLPNYIDPVRWEGVQKKQNDQVTIGWFGGASHLSDLKIIREVIPDLLAKYPNLVVKICGMFPDFLQEAKNKYPTRLQYVEWEQDVMKWEQHFASMGIDVMLAPLIDSQFNRCKSNIKWMESAMLNIPIVASLVDPYMCIKHKEDGFLAGKYVEWMKYVSQLIESKDLREQIGNTAHERVMKDFNMETHAKDWLDVYEIVRRNNELTKRGVVLKAG